MEPVFIEDFVQDYCFQFLSSDDQEAVVDTYRINLAKTMMRDELNHEIAGTA